MTQADESLDGAANHAASGLQAIDAGLKLCLAALRGFQLLDWTAAHTVQPVSDSRTEADAAHREEVRRGGPGRTNRALGRAGEERVLAHEHATLKAAGRDDLARKVRWAPASGYSLPSGESFTFTVHAVYP